MDGDLYHGPGCFSINSWIMFLKAKIKRKKKKNARALPDENRQVNKVRHPSMF